MKMQRLITGLIGSALIVFPGVAFAANQTPNNEISSGINTSGSSALVIDNIVCKGNDTTECDFITKKYYQAKGDVLDPSEIADAKLRLGTLIQFRDVDIHLEKGHKRGHVIVVFNITEASNIQWELGAGLHRSNQDTTESLCYKSYNTISNICFDRNGQSDNLGLTTTVTDFNFLGSGKRLSVGITASKYNSETQVDYSASNGTLPANTPLSYSSENDSHGYGFNATYYDPHLFDSTHYYLRSNLGRFGSSSDTIDITNMPDNLSITRERQSRSRSWSWGVETGRRFASHSFVALNVNKTFPGTASFTDDSDNQTITIDQPDSTNIGVTYGWDSQNDTLFPTQGSYFATSYNHSNSNGSSDGLSMNYLQHFSWQDKTVLSLGGGVSANRFAFRGFDARGGASSFHTSLKARLTSINSIDQANGIYSGWHGELNLSKTDYKDDPNNDISLNLQAGYTYQSDSMIYRFTLGYNTRESL
ncbi:MAG: hypothetical protein MJK04_18995 [Psychrosphaera sp.]|nr:hypothetical protein [Psychrosphaera sp.]